MPSRASTLRPEILRRSIRAECELRDNVSLIGREILKLLIEVAGQQQNGVCQFAFAAFRARSRKLPTIIVVPMVIAAIRSRPPPTSQRIGPPRKTL